MISLEKYKRLAGNLQAKARTSYAAGAPSGAKP